MLENPEVKDASKPDVLSPWWRQAVILVLIGGFTILVLLAIRTYRDAPPIPGTVVGPTGETIFTRADILAGQQVFLKYGLMENGTIWGHGAYLGPDFSAAYLHQLTLDAQETKAAQLAQKRWDQLTPEEQTAVSAAVQRDLKANRYDKSSDTLTFTEAEVVTFEKQIPMWAAYFETPSSSPEPQHLRRGQRRGRGPHRPGGAGNRRGRPGHRRGDAGAHQENRPPG